MRRFNRFNFFQDPGVGTREKILHLFSKDIPRHNLQDFQPGPIAGNHFAFFIQGDDAI